MSMEKKKRKVVKFPGIGSFRDIIGSVKRRAEFDGLDENEEAIINPLNKKPTIKFRGTVKIHGTNAGVLWNGEELWAQSKGKSGGNIITVGNDNAGFAFYVQSNEELLTELMQAIKKRYQIDDANTIAVYGEWCGKGIQKGVAVNELDKMFVIFKIKIGTPGEDEENIWLKYNPYDLIEGGDVIERLSAARTFFIDYFPTYGIDIDFNLPEDSQEQLVKMTTEVEKECPVGKHFGVSGIGEGIVWTGTDEDQSYIYKVKGEKHSNVKTTKKKDLAPVDIERMNNVKQFVDYAVTENRLEQGIVEVFTSQNVEISKKDIPTFLRWVQGDVMKEEIETLSSNGLEPKDVNKEISSRAVRWFMSKYG